MHPGHVRSDNSPHPQFSFRRRTFGGSQTGRDTDPRMWARVFSRSIMSFAGSSARLGGSNISEPRLVRLLFEGPGRKWQPAPFTDIGNTRAPGWSMFEAIIMFVSLSVEGAFPRTGPDGPWTGLSTPEFPFRGRPPFLARHTT